MAENVTNELMYETLKAIRGDIARLAERFDRPDGEMRVMRGHVAAPVRADLNHGSDWSNLSLRVQRIERRLELTEGTV
jgi:hypothetical protein